jgi:hypothetical protein
MKFFDYIFFRSYVATMKTKRKNNAEPRSLALVVLLQISILGAIMMIVFKLTGFYNNVEISRSESHNLRYLIALPLVFVFWYFNEKHYRKKSKDNYELLRKQFKDSIFNNIVPFWIIFLSPFILIFGIPFILSLIK